MAVEIKQLENSPQWVNAIGRSCSLEDAREVVDSLIGEDVAYDADEIDEMVSENTFIGSSLLRELESVSVLEEKGGMYYIDNKSRAKYVIKVTDN